MRSLCLTDRTGLDPKGFSPFQLSEFKKSFEEVSDCERLLNTAVKKSSYLLLHALLCCV